MLRRTVSAIAALALAGGSMAAQAAPQPAPRLGSSIEKSREDLGSGMWVLLVLAGGALVWAFIELTSDSEEEPVSP
jgi:hypothetical protein